MGLVGLVGSVGSVGVVVESVPHVSPAPKTFVSSHNDVALLQPHVQQSDGCSHGPAPPAKAPVCKLEQVLVSVPDPPPPLLSLGSCVVPESWWGMQPPLDVRIQPFDGTHTLCSMAKQRASSSVLLLPGSVVVGVKQTSVVPVLSLV